MIQSVHAYTSITSNYLPKARVLAESVRRVDPDVKFHLVLSDNPPVGFSLFSEPFDSVILAEELVDENFAQWAFGHSLVELCTAVKGVALEYIFSKYSAEQVFYFDPDMVVFGRMHDLQAELSHSSVILTPHLTDPEISEIGILDNELASLLHGVFNLGFVGVRNCAEGRRFAHWWAQRLLKFCRDDLASGIFTDQKWVNLAPCYFDGVAILRSPAYNVATWNLTNRKATGSLESGIFINGEPLGFYHFSGFDSGDQIVMLQRYGQDSPVLHELRDWYVAECERQGQSALGALKSKYDLFTNGLPIERGYRLLYRQRIDLQEAFPNPYLVSGSNCYKAWYDAHPAEHPPGDAVRIAPGTSIAEIMSELARQLTSMLNAGRGSNIVKRLLLRAWVKSLRLAVRILGRGDRA
jgi:hypothetical protein